MRRIAFVVVRLSEATCFSSLARRFSVSCSFCSAAASRDWQRCSSSRSSRSVACASASAVLWCSCSVCSACCSCCTCRSCAACVTTATTSPSPSACSSRLRGAPSLRERSTRRIRCRTRFVRYVICARAAPRSAGAGCCCWGGGWGACGWRSSPSPVGSDGPRDAKRASSACSVATAAVVMRSTVESRSAGGVAAVGGIAASSASYAAGETMSSRGRAVWTTWATCSRCSALALSTTSSCCTGARTAAAAWPCTLTACATFTASPMSSRLRKSRRTESTNAPQAACSCWCSAALVSDDDGAAAAAAAGARDACSRS
eukprot:Unigene13009_Nuclearia_a/m.39460 Unigene13009_Nuclearia_a/g.39460  ORF Unigene13009_Nuclearia_a/g.39460 Unigene13009_Nuclearia_a/m.39460 type:complete len:316 (-) Unigene13009_Nuclearia_a:532-1479(-)